MNPPLSTLTRRSLLKFVAVAGASSAAPRGLLAQAPGSAAPSGSVVRFLESLARADGGYAWPDQEMSHLTPTFGVIGSYRLLKLTPPNHARLSEFVRTRHPQHIKKLEQERRVFDFQQLQALIWLGADVAEFRPKIAAWTKPLAYLKQYERHGFPVMQSELGAVFSHGLLGLPVAGIAAAFGDYLAERQRANGSFNNTPASAGGDGHVMNTLWAVQALRVLGREVEKRDDLIRWLRSCQRAGNGAFTFAPQPEFGGVDDVAYTRAAVRALQLLGAEPADRDACIRYLHSLANPDGGFGDRTEWASNATACYYALEALDALGALDFDWERGRARTRKTSEAAALPAGLKLFSMQIEAHGQGSPAEAVELARALKIDFWGAKNASPAWMQRAQALANTRGVPVQFFTANEEYGTWVDVPGMGTYSHTSDLVAPFGVEIGPPVGTRARIGTATWPEFRERRLAPLEGGGGRLVWQFGENEELVRMLLDDSVERGGFAAISTFHFGNPDFMNTEPFVNRWRGRIPFIALQDAHGPEPWWFADMTTGFRTVFLAREPTWAGWLEALKRNWVVAIRRDTWTRGRTWMHGGSDNVVAFVRAREAEWRWWDNGAIARPMVSLVALTPADEFEAQRPESGTALRVRCAWENTPQGLAKQPITELVSLLVDDREVKPELIERKRPNGLYEEHCHRYVLAAQTPRGRHRATAVVRVRATGAEVPRTIDFDV